MYNSIVKEIGKLYDSGFRTPKEIHEQLKRQGKTCTINTVRTYLSVVKGARQMDNNVTNSNSNPSPNYSVHSDNRHVQEAPKRMENEAQTQPEQEIKTETQEPSLQRSTEGYNQGIEKTTENYASQPIQATDLIKSSNKFSLEGIQAPIQQEAQIMSDTYSSDFKPPVDLDKKMIPVKLFRIGAFNGDITAAIMKSERIKEATNGYEMGQEEINMINEDTKEVLETRLKLVDSEYGDIINLIIGYVNLGFKTLVHKITNPKAKEYIEKEAKKTEDKIIEGIEEAKQQIKTEAGEIIEVDSIDKVKEENLLCQSCSKNKIYQHGMCKDCYFNAEILKGQKAFDG